MDDWAYQMAKEFKKNKNVPVLGACIGKTISVSPFQVQILDGTILIDKDNGYVCKQLLGRESKYTAENMHTQSGTLNGESYTANGTMTQDGTVKLDIVWKPGDKVLVVPSSDGQKFFIVDILEV